MDEAKIRQISREEVQKAQMSSFAGGVPINSGVPYLPPHHHDGIDNLQIKQDDIIPSVSIMGKITFAENKTYRAFFNKSNPTRLDLNGIAINAVTNNCAVITGVAILNAAKYFQPINTSSFKEGGTQYPVIQQGGQSNVPAQCSTNQYFAMTNTLDSFSHVDQFYIVNAFFAPGEYIVTAELCNLTSTSIDIVITNLYAPNTWSLVANLIIT